MTLTQIIMQIIDDINTGNYANTVMTLTQIIMQITLMTL